MTIQRDDWGMTSIKLNRQTTIMVACQKDQCKHLIVMKDTFEDQEFIIGYMCEKGFTIEFNEDLGYARLAPECEGFEKAET